MDRNLVSIPQSDTSGRQLVQLPRKILKSETLHKWQRLPGSQTSLLVFSNMLSNPKQVLTSLEGYKESLGTAEAYRFSNEVSKILNESRKVLNHF